MVLFKTFNGVIAGEVKVSSDLKGPLRSRASPPPPVPAAETQALAIRIATSAIRLGWVYHRPSVTYSSQKSYLSSHDPIVMVTGQTIASGPGCSPRQSSYMGYGYRRRSSEAAIRQSENERRPRDCGGKQIISVTLWLIGDVCVGRRSVDMVLDETLRATN